MIGGLRRIYLREMFFPGWMGVFINPFYFARAGLNLAIADLANNLSGRLLDVGCGTKPYQKLFRVDAYIGLDIDTEESRKRGCAEHFYSGEEFPMGNESFDAVLCNQVLEHVFDPNRFVAEIARVLKPGGKLLLTVPFVWDEHEQPRDFGRYTGFALRAVLERQALRVIQHRKLGADASIVFQLANLYVFKVTQRLPKPVRLLILLPLISTINVLGVVARTLLPRNPDLYLDHIVLAEKVT